MPPVCASRLSSHASSVCKLPLFPSLWCVQQADFLHMPPVWASWLPMHPVCVQADFLHMPPVCTSWLSLHASSEGKLTFFPHIQCTQADFLRTSPVCTSWLSSHGSSVRQLTLMPTAPGCTTLTVHPFLDVNGVTVGHFIGGPLFTSSWGYTVSLVSRLGYALTYAPKEMI